MRKPINILVWQWGRRGAGPKIAVEFSKAVSSLPNVKSLLSLSYQAEIKNTDPTISLDLPVHTYTNILGYLHRLIHAPFFIVSLYNKIKKNNIDFAICTMPGPLDLLMAFVLKLLKIPYIVIIHDVYPHPGDGYIFQNFLQKLLVKQSNLTVTFSKHTYRQLIATNLVPITKIIEGWHPPFSYASSDNTEILPKKGDEVRLLNFGRLLFYKGLDLLEESLNHIHNTKPYILRIVGYGPKSASLDQLNQRSNVYVENRWVPEQEIAKLMQWADVIILPYREASQSGIAATALAFGKPILITNVGGLSEQLQHEEFVFLCEPTVEDIAKKINEILSMNFPMNREKYDSDLEWKKLATHLIKEISNKLHHS